MNSFMRENYFYGVSKWTTYAEANFVSLENDEKNRNFGANAQAVEILWLLWDYKRTSWTCGKACDLMSV